MRNRLHKSAPSRMIGGVCGGLGEYFDVDPSLMRLLFVLLAFWHGIGILVYLVLWIVVPRESGHDRTVVGVAPAQPGETAGRAEQAETDLTEVDREAPARVEGGRAMDRQTLAGALLVLLGLIILAENFHLLPWLTLGRLWPVALIAAGALLLYEQWRGRS